MSTCAPTSCENGQLKKELGEICDDGNLNPGDGWLEDCTSEPVLLGLGFAQIYAISTNGALKCWGVNWSGELGLGDSEHRSSGRKAISIAARIEHTCIVENNFAMRCLGLSFHWPIGPR